MKKLICKILLPFLLFILFSQITIVANELKDSVFKVNSEKEELNSFDSKIVQTYEERITKLIDENSQIKKENEEYQKALEISNQAFDKVTNAYWWLLSIICGIVFFVLGGNLLYQKLDRNKLVKSIKDELEKEYSKNTKGYLVKVSNEYNAKVKAIKSIIEQEFNSKLKFIHYDIDHALNEIKKLNLKLLENKFKDEKKKMPGLSMSTAVDILLMLIELYGDDKEHTWDDSFMEYLVYIEKMLKKNIKFDTLDANSVNELFERLPERFYKQKEILNNLIEYDDFDYELDDE